MRRRTRLLLLAASAGLLVPTVVDSSAVGAVDQDLALSAVAGPAGTEVTATSASCPMGDTDDGFAYLSARLLSGTGADEVLAGVGISAEDGEATFVVPDWIDPADDAVVEASCAEVSFAGEEPVVTTFAYDPVPFDVEASPDAPVQERTYSRTTLQAGQAFQVDATGCFLAGAQLAWVEVAQGSYLSFRTATDFVGGGFGEAANGSFSVPTAMSNSALDITVAKIDDDPPFVEQLVELPTDIPAGTYTSISYCSTGNGRNLVFEPQLIEITGNAPFDDIDLTVPAESRDVTVAGGSCAAGDVSLELSATDLEDVFDSEPFIDPRAVAGNAVRAQSPESLAAVAGSTGTATGHRAAAWSRALAPKAASRLLPDDDVLEATATPDAGGAWSFTDQVGFDHGLVEGSAWCGDPLADGFLYDQQAAVVSVTPVAPTVPPTATTTVPQSTPADAVSGTPTYAG